LLGIQPNRLVVD
ncbi:hypothetical protein CMV_027028, partial [Castanea mollissima]